MFRSPWLRLICFQVTCTVLLFSLPLRAQDRAKPSIVGNGSTKEWKFVVSGDSRNCGDAVMPMIAQGAAVEHATFYWHLGDLRAIYQPDEDMGGFDPSWHTPVPKLSRDAYLESAWRDFREKQVKPFKDKNIPFFIGIGNHETIPPMARRKFRDAFQDLLDIDPLREQRELDKQQEIQTYYHWVRDGIDFIYLDNASDEEFDPEQMKWIMAQIERDRTDRSIRTIVVGMHKALPGGYSDFHSMSETQLGLQTGRCVYHKLLDLRSDSKKPVYILASHSHFFMHDMYDTPYWRNVGVLPGWIVGTAGAVRYRVPADTPAGSAKTDVYGYLVGTVNADGQPGKIRFDFHEIPKPDSAALDDATLDKDLVNFCFNSNKQMSASVNQPPPPATDCQ